MKIEIEELLAEGGGQEYQIFPWASVFKDGNKQGYLMDGDVRHEDRESITNYIKAFFVNMYPKEDWIDLLSIT